MVSIVGYMIVRFLTLATGDRNNRFIQNIAHLIPYHTSRQAKLIGGTWDRYNLLLRICDAPILSAHTDTET
jgi:uncharacterized membrane protein